MLKKSFLFSALFCHHALLFVFLVVSLTLLEIKVLGLQDSIHIVILRRGRYGNWDDILPFLFIIIPNGLPRNRRMGDYGFWDIKGLVRFTIAYFRCCVPPTWFLLNYQQIRPTKTIQEIKGKRKVTHRFRKIIASLDQLTV